MAAECTHHSGEVNHGRRNVRQLATLRLHAGSREQQMLAFQLTSSLFTQCVIPGAWGASSMVTMHIPAPVNQV